MMLAFDHLTHKGQRYIKIQTERCQYKDMKSVIQNETSMVNIVMQIVMNRLYTLRYKHLQCEGWLKGKTKINY